ncbi:hypothetical protein [Luteirhabdus pelagi]|uniref:hypothetical protein n=1 Tax=Luteirhabdus pelagi TaxID=2792783 RepID=UPI001939F074|nr:hypothetical protein [Luteirhabdus pelagi]
MRREDFDKLELGQQLSLIVKWGIEVDNIFPWYGDLKIITIYLLDDFFIALECNLAMEKITHVKTFIDLEYLEKYPHYYKDKLHTIMTKLNL